MMEDLGGTYEYDRNDLIGHGAFAVVYKGHYVDAPEKPVAIKMVAKKSLSKSKRLLNKEIEILKELSSLRHENLVGLFRCIEHPTHVFLVMEYCNAGDLSEYLTVKKTLSQETIRLFTRQFVKAVAAMKSKEVVHRDIKPSNILLQNLTPDVPDPAPRNIRLKIADFGFARILEDGVMAATFCGSPLYMAPEILLSQKYCAKADLWSVGAILYQCLTGRAPFQAASPKALKAYYEKNKEIIPNIPSQTSPKLRDLLIRLLRKNPKQRISFDDFCVHEFLFERETSSSAAQQIQKRGSTRSVSGGGKHQQNGDYKRRRSSATPTAAAATSAVARGGGAGVTRASSHLTTRPSKNYFQGYNGYSNSDEDEWGRRPRTSSCNSRAADQRRRSSTANNSRNHTPSNSRRNSQRRQQQQQQKNGNSSASNLNKTALVGVPVATCALVADRMMTRSPSGVGFSSPTNKAASSSLARASSLRASSSSRHLRGSSAAGTQQQQHEQRQSLQIPSDGGGRWNRSISPKTMGSSSSGGLNAANNTSDTYLLDYQSSGTAGISSYENAPTNNRISSTAVAAPNCSSTTPNSTTTRPISSAEDDLLQKQQQPQQQQPQQQQPQLFNNNNQTNHYHQNNGGMNYQNNGGRSSQRLLPPNQNSRQFPPIISISKDEKDVQDSLNNGKDPQQDQQQWEQSTKKKSGKERHSKMLRSSTDPQKSWSL